MQPRARVAVTSFLWKHLWKGWTRSKQLVETKRLAVVVLGRDSEWSFLLRTMRWVERSRCLVC